MAFFENEFSLKQWRFRIDRLKIINFHSWFLSSTAYLENISTQLLSLNHYRCKSSINSIDCDNFLWYGFARFLRLWNQSAQAAVATKSFKYIYQYQRQYKVRVSGKMQLLQKKIEDKSPAQNRLTRQKQLLKRKEAALVTLWGAECQTL